MKLGIIIAAGVLALGATAFAADNAKSDVTCTIGSYVSVSWQYAVMAFGTVTYPETKTLENTLTVSSNQAGTIAFSGTPFGSGIMIPEGWHARDSGFDTTRTVLKGVKNQLFPIWVQITPDLTIAPMEYSGTIVATFIAGS